MTEASPARRLQHPVIALYVIIVGATAAYGLVWFWPGTGQETQVGVETRYLILATLAGFVGACLHWAASMAEIQLQEGSLRSDINIMRALLHPFVGACSGAVFYLVVRGGLVTTASALSPFGVVSICGLAGMFGQQTVSQLQQVFDHLFKVDSENSVDDRR